MKFLQRNKPDLSLELVESVLAETYGLRGDLTSFESERDQNIKVDAADDTYLFKVCNQNEPAEVIDLQIRALRHIEAVDPVLPVPRALQGLGGQDTGTVVDEGVTYTHRLMSYLDGDVANRAEHDTPQLRHNTGSVLARLDKALSSFFHPAADQDHPWNLMGAPRLLEHAEHIPDGTARANVELILERARDHTVPACRLLRHQVIHQDAHTGNLVVDPDDPALITGIIDFGDMAFAPLVVELAVATHLSGRPDGSPETMLDVVLGFDSVNRVEEGEVDVLYDLVLARLAMNATIAAARVALYPDEDPYEDDQDRLWRRIDDALSAREDVISELRGLLGFGRGSSTGLAKRREAHLTPHSPHFYAQPLEIVAGAGMYLFGVDGSRYLDFYNNVPTVGHNHPQVVNAVSRQLARLNTNTRYLYESVVEYAERLTGTLDGGLDVCLFVNSGSEANDVAGQIVKHAAGHDNLLAVEGSYHGVTEASDAVTEPHGSNVSTVGLEDAEVPDRVAGFIVDPALTSKGMPVVPDGALGEIAAVVQQQGGLVVADEVQSGFGRTGVMWGHEREGLKPDLVTMGKPVGNGFPLGVVVTRRDLLEPFLADTGLFSTFGGNPVACAAGLAVLDVVEREDLVVNSAVVGAYLKERLLGLGNSSVVDVRGTGLLVGVELDQEIVDVERLLEDMKGRGVLVGTAGRNRNVLKLRPPLIARLSDIDFFVEALADSIDQGSL